MQKFTACRPKALPAHKVLAAAEYAIEENPANHAPIERLMALRGPVVFPTNSEPAYFAAVIAATRGL